MAVSPPDGCKPPLHLCRTRCVRGAAGAARALPGQALPPPAHRTAALRRAPEGQVSPAWGWGDLGGVWGAVSALGWAAGRRSDAGWCSPSLCAVIMSTVSWSVASRVLCTATWQSLATSPPPSQVSWSWGQLPLSIPGPPPVHVPGGKRLQGLGTRHCGVTLQAWMFSP